MRSMRFILRWLVVGAALAAPHAALSASANAIVSTGDRVADFAKCLADEREVVLRPDQDPQCVEARTGGKLLDDVTPEQRDPRVVCRSEHRGDRRRLPSDIIRELADPKHRIAPTGIRLIGAVFCSDEVNLSDLTLPYSLVLDRAMFRFGVRGQNFRTRGNFSLDGSYVFDNLALSGSKIEGSLFARRGYFENVGLVETEVRGSIYFDDSLLEDFVLFDRVTVAGEIRFRNAALSRVRVQQSTIRGRLDFTDSEARCGYTVRGGEIDEIRGTNLGFGTLAAGPPHPRYGWARSDDKDYYKTLMQNASIKSAAEAPQACAPAADFEPELQLVDVRARSFCLQSFHWLASADSKLQPRSAISLTDVKVAGNMNVNLYPPRRRADREAVLGGGESEAAEEQELALQRMLRIAGLNTGVLFFDFSDNDRPYRTSIDRLQMERIHSSIGLDCSRHPTEADSKLPDVSHVTGWLHKNTTLSLQPMTAFIRAFENAGANPTGLKVAKAQIEFDRTLADRNNATAAAWNTKTVPAFLWEDGFRVLVDYLRLAGAWVLGLIADHGFRPVKVLWSVLIILVGFWLLFRFGLGIVAFLPDRQTELRPVGFTFVFDRLIPIYRLREENYQIARFYQRGIGSDERASHYFWRTGPCVPALPWQTHYAGICLDILKALGMVLAVFMIAALNALVQR